MKYRIDKIATKVTWDELTCTGNVEVTTLIDGIEKQALENQTGLYLTRSEAYTEPVLCACVMDAEGNEKDRIFPLPLENEISFCMRVEQPKLWNAEDPYCYNSFWRLWKERISVMIAEQSCWRFAIGKSWGDRPVSMEKR